jgi:uncharacterized membrane protein YqjE
MDGKTENVRGLMVRLVDDVSTLVRKEIELARAESSEKVNEVATGFISIGAGLLVAVIALIVLVEAVVAALAEFMAPGWAALIVGVVLALIAFALVQKGSSNLSSQNLALPRTQASLRRDKETVMESAR